MVSWGENIIQLLDLLKSIVNFTFSLNLSNFFYLNCLWNQQNAFLKQKNKMWLHFRINSISFDTLLLLHLKLKFKFPLPASVSAHPGDLFPPSVHICPWRCTHSAHSGALWSARLSFCLSPQSLWPRQQYGCPPKCQRASFCLCSPLSFPHLPAEQGQHWACGLSGAWGPPPPPQSEPSLGPRECPVTVTVGIWTLLPSSFVLYVDISLGILGKISLNYEKF